MNGITIGIKKDNYVFEGYYSLNGKSYFLTCKSGKFIHKINYYSRKYFYTTYKNLRFSGAGAKSFYNWGIYYYDGFTPFIWKDGNRISILGKTYINPYYQDPFKDIINSFDEKNKQLLLDEKINELYRKCTESYYELFSKIVNVQEFEEQLKIRLGNLKDREEGLIIKDLRACFKRFINSEKDSKQLKLILTPKYFIRKYDLLNKYHIEQDNLTQIVQSAITKFWINYEEICLDIDYSRKPILEEILSNIQYNLENYVCEQFASKINSEYLANILGADFDTLISTEQFILDISNLIKAKKIDNENALCAMASDKLQEYLVFEKEYGEHIEKVGKEKIIDLTPEKEKRFQDYKAKKINLSKEEELEYEYVYKKIITAYKRRSYVSTTQPNFEKTRNIINLLLECNILYEEEDKVIVNKNGDIEKFLLELYKNYN